MVTKFTHKLQHMQRTVIHLEARWCSNYHYCTISFNKIWTLILIGIKSFSLRVEDIIWWKSLTMVPEGNKVKRPSLVNHFVKTIHHHHRHHHYHHHLHQLKLNLHHSKKYESQVHATTPGCRYEVLDQLLKILMFHLKRIYLFRLLRSR